MTGGRILWFVALAALVGCSQASPADDGVDATESDLKLKGTGYLGPINDGDTLTSPYSDPPEYRAYGFKASGGDSVTANVKSKDGDAMAWITDASYNVLVANDDASSSTTNAKVTYKVPSSVSSKSYRIVFRDYDHADATFQVSLDIKSGSGSSSGSSSGGPPPPSCSPPSEPWRTYLGSPTMCKVIRYNCPKGTHSFSNACGCGCEDD
jgi:hypothetical protein